MSEPLISVVICTLDRPHYLSKALEGLARQSLAAGRYEVIVVDNGPHGATAEVVARFAASPVVPRYVVEPRRGLSHARNKGVAVARGSWVAYLDDDAVPDPDWLRNADEELASAPAKLGMLGGSVVPLWEGERPPWLADGLLGYLTMVDLGPGRRAVDSLSGIVGANMFIPRALLADLGGFSSRLGRKGRSLLSNEELFLKMKLAERGYSALYRSDVRVQHHVPPDRLTRRWFLRRLYWQGRSDAIMRRFDEPFIRRALAGSAIRMGREAWRWFRRWLGAGPSRPESFELLTTSFYNFGYAVGELAGAIARPRRDS